MVEERGELFVHGVEDAVVAVAFRAVAPFIQRREKRAVDVVRPEVEEEAAAGSAGLVDEGDCSLDEAGGDAGALGPGDG